MIIDRKFVIKATNPVTKKEYTEENSLLLCAHDKCVPAALRAYLAECERQGSDPGHMESIELLIDRVEEYQCTVKSKVPDTVGGELKRCIDGDL